MAMAHGKYLVRWTYDDGAKGEMEWFFDPDNDRDGIWGPFVWDEFKRDHPDATYELIRKGGE